MSFSTLGISSAIFASRCKDVHEGNPGSVRSMVLGRGGARKETSHHVLDSGPFIMARGGSSAVVASRIKIIEEPTGLYWRTSWARVCAWDGFFKYFLLGLLL
jgi:tartrate dehydratase beta subunit/fumarate hydratase class I family protein